MRERAFEDVRDELFRLYHAGDYAAAYALIVRAAPRLTEYDSRMLRWHACLANRVGRLDEALATLQRALGAGHWYGDVWLRGDDGLRSLHCRRRERCELPARGAAVAVRAARRGRWRLLWTKDDGRRTKDDGR